jgi:hypothetical protein
VCTECVKRSKYTQSLFFLDVKKNFFIHDPFIYENGIFSRRIEKFLDPLSYKDYGFLSLPNGSTCLNIYNTSNYEPARTDIYQYLT